jgi:tetratricopeptide (TPR) repeat protein
MAVCKLQKREYSDVAKFIEECRTLYDTYELKVSELDHLKLLNILGIVYTETNLYQLALLTLQSALVMAREHNHYELFTEVLNNLGVLYLKTGMVNEALEVFKVCYQKKLQITGADSPTLVSTVFNVVECYTRLERFEDAVLLLKDIRKLLTKNDMISDICEMHLRMGAIEHMRGRVKEAKACLELSKQYVTDQPDIRYGHLQHQIGLLEMTLGDRVRARKCLEEACKIYVGFTNKDNDLVKKG